jgi:hypothetical protein
VNDQKYIKLAVDLADGWSWQTHDMNIMVDGFTLFAAPNYYLDKPMIDALAVQIMRQANTEVKGGLFTHHGDSMDVIRTVVRWQQSRRK